jgi:hypothetical protein
MSFSEAEPTGRLSSFPLLHRTNLSHTGVAVGPVSLIVRVRHEVADVAVRRCLESADRTCCSASSILPGVVSSRDNVASSFGRAAKA